jgi:uncharacterized membrane protein
MLLLNAASTLFMTGLIWFVQIVHYPLFAGVGTERFANYEARHSTLTTFVVALPMLVELLTSVALVGQHFEGIAIWQRWLALGLTGVIWFSTAFLQVPQHTLLSQGFNETANKMLVSSNWFRTLAWTLRSCLVVWGLYLEMK